MEKKARVDEEGSSGRSSNRLSLIERLPQSLLIEILSRLDLDSLCSAAPVSTSLRSAVSQTLDSLPSIDLSDFSPSKEILNSVIRNNKILRSLTVDCSRLDDSSIELFAKEHLQELVLLKCFKFSSNVFCMIRENCPKLRLLTLEMVYQYGLESLCAYKKVIEEMLDGCSHLESLFIKFPNQNLSPGNYESFNIVLPKALNHLLLQPISIEHAKLMIPVDSRLQSLSLVLDKITDELVISIAVHLDLLVELSLEDKPSEEPSLHNDLTNTGLLSLGFCTKLKRLSLTRSRENCVTSFRRVNDVGVFLLAEKCKELESVRLAGFSKVTDAGYACILHSCKNLKRFEIVNAFFLSDLAFLDLANAPSALVDVRLISCSLLTSETAKSLSFCQNLEMLDLSGCKSIADTGLKFISKLCKLTKLDLSGADITDGGLSALGTGSSPIVSLSLRGCKRITDRGISFLLRGESLISRTLVTLDLGYMPGISDRAITSVAELCRELTSLCIRSCFPVSDESIKALGSLKSFSDERRQIRRLDLFNCCGLSIDSFGHLALPFFPGLRWLGVGNTRLSGKGKEKLVDLSRVHPGLSICISGCEMCCNVGWQFHESI